MKRDPENFNTRIIDDAHLDNGTSTKAKGKKSQKQSSHGLPPEPEATKSSSNMKSGHGAGKHNEWKHDAPRHRSFSGEGYAAGLSHVITLNTYPNGISLTLHRINEVEQHEGSFRGLSEEENYAHTQNRRDSFFLRTRETRDFAVPEGKFLVYRDNIKFELEEFFRALSKKGILKETGVYLGVFTDPFHGFHKKFAQTMACLDVIERFQPAKVIIQSRSRMLLTALPLLKTMGSRAHCVIPFESRLEKSIQRYTPGQPRLEERLVTAAGLRAQGIEVNFAVTPLLPYGSTSGDTWKFAELLVTYSDKVLMQPLCLGDRHEEAILRNLPLASKLEADGELRLLRPNCHEELWKAISKLSPDHLLLSAFKKQEPQQLALFAA
ncbi:MAG TPA: hypothetical protein PKA63_01735 [Oligoflexia bacterium]|nr:hypothetical protein [Oligoflexia bacterium]HMP47371.1 hypothetical protein [Oligoflexia bacterium]